MLRNRKSFYLRTIDPSRFVNVYGDTFNDCLPSPTTSFSCSHPNLFVINRKHSKTEKYKNSHRKPPIIPNNGQTRSEKNHSPFHLGFLKPLWRRQICKNRSNPKSTGQLAFNIVPVIIRPRPAVSPLGPIMLIPWIWEGPSVLANLNANVQWLTTHHQYYITARQAEITQLCGGWSYQPSHG